MLVDTHCHLNFEVFEENWREVVEEALRGGVEKMVVVGTDIELSQRAIDISERHPALYATVGIHPHHAREFLISNDKFLNKSQLINDQINKLTEMAKHPKVVAIGEVGLDKHHYISSQYSISNDQQERELINKLQKELLVRQVELAVEMDKALILHSREVGDEVLEQLQVTSDKLQAKLRGVFHCFEGGEKYARRILEAGFYLGFTGNITYAFDRAEVAKTVPLDRLLLETDSPYMTPEPLRTQFRQLNPKGGLVNTPLNVKIVAEKQAEVHGISVEEVEEETNSNVRELFGI